VYPALINHPNSTPNIVKPSLNAPPLNVFAEVNNEAMATLCPELMMLFTHA
jgi:hypothetical protein